MKDFSKHVHGKYLLNERTTKNVLAGLLMRDFFNLAPSAIMLKIRSTILKGKIEDKIFQNSNAWARKAA